MLALPKGKCSAPTFSLLIQSEWLHPLKCDINVLHCEGNGPFLGLCFVKSGKTLRGWDASMDVRT